MNPGSRVVLEHLQDPQFSPSTLGGIVEVESSTTIDALLRDIRATGSRSLEILADQPGRSLDSPGRVAMLAHFLREEGYQATLYTRDANLAAMALDAGISVAGHASSVVPVPVPETSSIFEPILSAPHPTVSSLPTPRLWNRPRVPRLLLVRIGLIGAAALVGYLLFAFYLAPSATVVLTPDIRLVPIEATVRVDPDVGGIDLRQQIIPATVVEAVVQYTLAKPTTGRRREAQSFATGFVTLRNRTREVVIAPRGIRITAVGGTAYISEAEVMVPPTLPVSGKPVPGEAIVAVTAERSGPDGNLPALAVNGVEGPLGTLLEAFNAQPIQGGTEREVALVAQRDVDELAAVLEERVESAAVEHLRRERPANQTLVVWSSQDGNPQVITREFSANVDDRATTLSLDLALRARGTSFANSDLARVLREVVAGIPGQDAEALDNVRVIKTEVVSDSWGVLELRVRAVGEAVTFIDPGAVSAALAGLSLDDGSSMLAAMPGVSRYQVRHDPSDTANFPRVGLRIDVQVTSQSPAATR